VKEISSIYNITAFKKIKLLIFCIGLLPLCFCILAGDKNTQSNQWKRINEKTFASDNICTITIISKRMIQEHIFVSCEIIPATEEATNKAFQFLFENIPTNYNYLRVFYFDKKGNLYSEKSKYTRQYIKPVRSEKVTQTPKFTQKSQTVEEKKSNSYSIELIIVLCVLTPFIILPIVCKFLTPRVKKCNICGNLIKKKFYYMKIDGKKYLLCPYCNNTIEKKKSRDALKEIGI